MKNKKTNGRPRSYGTRGSHKPKRALRRITAAAALVAVVAVLFYVGNNTIHMDSTEVYIKGLPGDLDGLRILQVSDLHGRQFGEDNEKLIKAVNDAKPDIIAITGDLVDEIGELDQLPSLAKALSEIAPVYYVTGNHEWAHGLTGRIDDIFAEAGVTVLHNSFSDLKGSDGGGLVLAGIDDPNGRADMESREHFIERIRESRADAPIVLLAHRNDPHYYEDLDVSLVICGHGHGGIIRIPLVGGLIGTDRSLFPRFTGGLYDIGGPRMFVSRGLGGYEFEPRLFNRPHLPIIILRSS